MMRVQKVINIYKSSMDLKDRRGGSKASEYTKSYGTSSEKRNEDSNSKNSFQSILKKQLSK